MMHEEPQCFDETPVGNLAVRCQRLYGHEGVHRYRTNPHVALEWGNLGLRTHEATIHAHLAVADIPRSARRKS